MRTLLAFAILITLSTVAHAQDKIIVIDEHGNVSEVDIGASPVVPKAKDKPAPASPPPSLRRTAPAVIAPTSTPTPAPAADPVAEPAAENKAVKKEITPAKKPAPPVKKKKEAAPAKQKTKQKQAAAAKSAPAAQPYVSPRPQRLGPAMTPEDAIRIALDVAPPARTVSASPVNYKGLHAYEVLFVTEEGDQFVYIDRETGKIVK